MKSIGYCFYFLVLLSGFSQAQQAQVSEASLQIINHTLASNETGIGFHSIHMFSTRQLGDRSKSHADAKGIHFEEKLSDNKFTEKFYAFADIKKVTVLDGNKSKFGKENDEEIQLLILFKGGRMIIIGTKKVATQVFLDALENVLPEKVKINYTTTI